MTAMRIGYDVSILEHDRFTGVEKVAYYLFSTMWEKYPQNVHLLFCRRRPPRLATLPQNAEIVYVRCGRFWRWQSLPRAVQRRRTDVFISPVSALPGPCNTPLIAYVHECAWRHEALEPVNWRHRLALWLAAWRCEVLLVNSQTTYADLRQEPFCRTRRIEVVSPALDPMMTEQSKPRSSILRKLSLIAGRYCLFVSTIRRKKNVGLLIDAFSSSSLRHLPLVCVGRIDDPSLVAEAKARGAHNIHFTGYLTDAAIRELYRNALCFLYISRHEGFGFPILEAFAHDCPLIASATGSIPEVAAQAAYFLRDFSKTALIEAVSAVESDESLRNTLITAGRQRSMCYSWEKSAAKLYSIASEVAERRKQC